MAKKKTVLLIDDDPGIREPLALLLRGAGITVYEACDGLKGVTLFRDVEPNLVITDLVMPAQQGYKTIWHIRRVSPHVKIIAMSGGAPRPDGTLIAGEEMLESASQFGADFVFLKPFEPSDMIQKVFEIMNEIEGTP
ncbi:MAG: response regulator [Myxococcota bacterium]|nr:response regulator [Myxococcota bacterium]